jgi:hypothetical protein
VEAAVAQGLLDQGIEVLVVPVTSVVGQPTGPLSGEVAYG